MARKEKQPIHKVQMTEGKRNIIRQLLHEYEIESAEDIQNALKDLLGGTIKDNDGSGDGCSLGVSQIGTFRHRGLSKRL